MRVAVALVAGQAALCAVIGWVTLGGMHPHKAGAPRAANPLVEGPLVVPPPTVAPAPPTPVPPAPPVTARTAATSAGRITRPPESTAAEPRRPIAPTPNPVTATRPVPPAAPTLVVSPSGANLVQTPSATPTEVQQGVAIGDPCDPVNAAGTTDDGTPVLCVPGDDGTPRWQIN